MPRLVRRRPLLDRIRDHLDPRDVLLQLAEILNDDTYDEWLQDWAIPIGVVCNVLFIIAQLAGKPSLTSRRRADDVFGDYEGKSGSGWFGWMAACLIPVLTCACFLNTAFVFLRKRQYRLFEQSVDEAPPTPSAHLVRVDSSPASSSPLRYIQRVLSDATSGSRPYADPEREVWEISMWDPKPFHLTLFTLFSPGHLILYFSLLPPTPMDPVPSVKVLLAFLFGTLLSLQLGYLRSSFTQQAKDSAFIHGQVMNEYDTKFVHPTLNRPIRDVGTQTRESATTPRGTRTREVDIYTPTTIVNRGFRTNPNANYARQYDPDNLSSEQQHSGSRRTSDIGVQRSATAPSLITPNNPYLRPNGYTTHSTSFSRPSTSASTIGGDFSSPLKPHHERLRERSPAKGDGGSFGVYNHAASPLRKAASSNQLTAARRSAGSGGAGGGSGLKRTSTPGGVNGALEGSGGGGRRRETGRF